MPGGGMAARGTSGGGLMENPEVKNSKKAAVPAVSDEEREKVGAAQDRPPEPEEAERSRDRGLQGFASAAIARLIVGGVGAAGGRMAAPPADVGQPAQAVVWDNVHKARILLG
mmetsp:Transcript_19040/g.42434  ORF Transcript_19040/g.42434 Transcript_19040/m.42434 type:complete len:113 (+) Transcript_19040:474-812(+)